MEEEGGGQRQRCQALEEEAGSKGERWNMCFAHVCKEAISHRPGGHGDSASIHFILCIPHSILPPSDRLPNFFVLRSNRL